MNKKGMTLVEIIISIVLISIVLIFLFSLLITVNDINKESEVNSTYLINKSLILKNIETDFDNASSVKLTTCTNGVKDFYTSYNPDDLETNQKASRCLKFVYNYGTSKESEAFLGIYYYKRSETETDKNGYVISYIHEKNNVRATRLLPNYEENTKNIKVDSNNIIDTWKYNGNAIPTSEIILTNGSFQLITIPIIGPDGKDYSINISYYKKI